MTNYDNGWVKGAVKCKQCHRRILISYVMANSVKLN
jgi:hypothetical protein